MAAEIMKDYRSDVDYVNDLYSTSKNYYRGRRDQFVKFYKQYRGILDADTSRDFYKWRSRLFIPATSRALDGLLPDLMLNLFASDPFFEIRPRESFDVLDAAIAEPLLLYQFESCGFYLKFFHLLKQMGFYGSTFGKCFVEGGNNNFEFLDIFNMFYSPRATKLSDTYIIQRNERTIGEMRHMKVNGIPVYENLNELELAIARDHDSDRYDREVKKSIQGLPSAYSAEKGDDRKVELLEYWKVDRSETMTIAGQSTVVRPKRANPYGRVEGEWYDPYVFGALWPNPGELEGVGVPEKIKDIQDRINCEVNQRLDNRNLRQNLIILVRRGAGVNVRNLISRPGAIWMTDDMSAVAPQTIPDVSSSTSFAEEQQLEEKCEEITGVTKSITGMPAETRRTATEVASNIKMSSKSFALHIKIIEEMLLKPILTKFCQLNNNPTFMNVEKVMRIVGKEGAAWRPVLVTPNFRILGSSGLMDANLKVQQMMTFLQVTAQDPTFDKNRLYRKIYEGWGFKDFDSLKLPPTPPPPPPPPTPGGMPPTPPQTMGGVPVEPTGVRPPSPFEGGEALMMGGGGERPTI